MNILEYENYHETTEHGAFEFPYETYLCSIPLDFDKVPLHWHEQMEIIYIKKGAGIISLSLDRRKVTEGTLVFIFPGNLHSIEQFEDEKMEYENIIFNPDMLISKSADSTNSNLLMPLFSDSVSVNPFVTPDLPYYDAIRFCVDKCDRINGVKPEGYELFIKGNLFLLLFELYKNRQADLMVKPKVSERNTDKLKSVFKYIENNYHEKITISSIAEIAGFSESHFMRYFKDQIGVSFVDYLNDYRLTMAARLLQASDNSIISIAEEVGFDNASYFTRSFKRKYSVTPNEYRKGNL